MCGVPGACGQPLTAERRKRLLRRRLVTHDPCREALCPCGPSGTVGTTPERPSLYPHACPPPILSSRSEAACDRRPAAGAVIEPAAGVGGLVGSRSGILRAEGPTDPVHAVRLLPQRVQPHVGPQARFAGSGAQGRQPGARSSFRIPRRQPADPGGAARIDPDASWRKARGLEHRGLGRVGPPRAAVAFSAGASRRCRRCPALRGDAPRALGIPAGDGPADTELDMEGVGRAGDRPFRPGPTQRGVAEAERARREGRTGPETEFRSDRTAANPPGGRGFRRRPLPGSLCKCRGPLARVAALRGALGPPLDGRGALRRDAGGRLELREQRGVALPRLSDPRPQCRRAVRPACP